MEREHRYWVAKVKDVEKYLSEEQQLSLDRHLTKIRIGRLNDGKADVKTVCVDSDWPEYETVWKMIEARVDGRASHASVPVTAPDCRIADRGFRWDAETRQHIPQLLIEFTPVPANAPNDSKGWKDRDKLAAMLAAAPTPPENKALLEAVAEVVWYDPQLSHSPEKPGKIIDGSIAFMESAKIGTKLFAAPVSSVSEDQKDAELLDYIQNHGATIQIVPMANRTFGFEVGGLHKSRKLSVREAIDAAMQEDKL